MKNLSTATAMPGTALLGLIETQWEVAINDITRYIGLPPSTPKIYRTYTGSRMMIAEWEVTGVLDAVPQAGRYSEAAALHTLLHPDDPRNGALKGSGLILDAMDIFTKCFTHVGVLLEQGVDLRAFLPEDSLTLSELESGEFDIAVWKSRIADGIARSTPSIPAPAPATTFLITMAPSVPVKAGETGAERIRRLREQLTLDEGEAAEVLGWSRKRVGNWRREAKIPRTIWRQADENCMIDFDTQGVVAVAHRALRRSTVACAG